MIRSHGVGAAIIAACLSLSPAIQAAENGSTLELVPKDAAGFVHIRVSDVWKHDAFAPIRDYLTKTEPVLLKEFEKELGFLPSDVDTLTLIYPSFSRQSLAPPVIAVRTIKPYDKGKVVTALRGLSPAQWQEDRGNRFNFGGGFGPATAQPPEAMPFPGPKGGPFPNPPPLPPIEKKPDVEPQCGDKDDPPANEPGPFEPHRPTPDLRARHYILGSGDAHLYCLDDHTLVVVPAPNRDSNLEIMPYVIQLLRRQEKGPMDTALARAATSTAVIAIDSAAFGGTLPNKLGSEDENLLRPIMLSKTAMLSLDLGKELKATFSFLADNVETARKIEDGMHGAIGTLKKGIPEWRKDAKRAVLPELATLLVDQIELAVNNLAVQRKDQLVMATTSLKPDEAFLAALKAGVAQVKVARERTISANNLKQIGVALHNYHDANGRLPFPGVTRFGAPLGPGNNNPNLSWRVAILPYIEQEPLYRQFKFDEPWDSAHNKALIEKMPKVFAPVNGVKADKGHTYYQIFTGREAMKSGMTLVQVTDGTSNTLMVVESGDAVPWTRPDDMIYDAKKPLPKLGALFNGDFNALMMDGSVRFIRKGIDENILRALITVAGGEVIPNNSDR